MLTFILPKSTKNFSFGYFHFGKKEREKIEIYRVPVTNLVVIGSIIAN